MKTIKLGKSGLTVPTLAVGCMRYVTLGEKDAEKLIGTALENGANFFDHADIYGGGGSEEVFAKAIHMSPAVREKIFLQSKCGIVPGKYYDFSKEHILSSVEGILKRLQTEYLDVLLLHRPDALMDPEEVAEAFDALHTSGKVRNFGVSNMNPMQIQLLEKYLHQPIVANQLQLSPTNATMITAGIHVNMGDAGAVNRDGSILDYCRLNDITIQTWSPFLYGMMEGVYLGNPDYPELNAKIDEIAEKYGVTNSTVVIAWILRHPAKFQPVIGSTTPSRLLDCIRATEITLTKQEWYEIYLSAGNILP